MEHAALNHLLLLLFLSVLTVWMLRRCHLPPLLGYLAVGILVGPHATDWVPASAALDTLAETGLVFLLFMVGLEFSVPRLLAMRKTVFGLGLAQVFISSLTGGTLVWSLGIGWQAALVVGGMLALSSTAIVARQLGEQMEMQTRHGQLAIGILLFQDLAVVPLLVAIPILATGSTALALPLTLAIVKGLLAFLLMYVAGHYMLQRFFHQVADAHSAELFTLSTLLVALAAAWVTYQLGLSLVLGAFLAGIMLSETEYRQQIEVDIRPFRDVLMGVFFISVGTRFNVATVYFEWFWVGLLTTGLVFGKAAVIAILTRLHGYDPLSSVRTGVALGQGSEFGFAILIVALNHNLLSPSESQPIIAAIVLSMLIAPILIRFNQAVTARLLGDPARAGERAPAESLRIACENMRDHVLICGFGRIGQNLALFLRDNKIEHVALELDRKLIREAREAGEQVFYGDATHRQALLHAAAATAHAVIITFDDIDTTRRIIRTAKTIKHELPIIVRSHHDKNMQQLLACGATDVVPESFESSMMLAEHVLEHLGMTSERAMAIVESARNNEYQRLRAVFHGEVENTPTDASTLVLSTVIVLADSFSDGKRLSELELARHEVSVNSLRKGQTKIDHPEPDTVLEEGDAVVLRGTMTALQQARRHLLLG